MHLDWRGVDLERRHDGQGLRTGGFCQRRRIKVFKGFKPRGERNNGALDRRDGRGCLALHIRETTGNIRKRVRQAGFLTGLRAGDFLDQLALALFLAGLDMFDRCGDLLTNLLDRPCAAAFAIGDALRK